MFGSERIFSVMYAEKASLSTASAPPAGTFVASAASMTSEPNSRISSFKRPQALPHTSPLLSELLHTSSARFLLEWAGVNLFGLLSYSRTENPCRAR